ncbi:MAG: hypothetical protein MJE12_09970, partial [Alphaproteobacteria bacterium]|nr:hypothetical protein [Alphaproteobacteria bacterium]
MDRPLRILLAPLDICGIFGCLRNGFAALGHEAHFVDLGRAAQGGLPPETAWPVRAFHRAHHRTQQTISMAKWMPQRILWSVLYCASRALLTIWAIFRIDVFVFKSGESLYSSLVDQKIFRAFNKTIVHAFYGSDERPPYLNPGVGGVDDIDHLAERVRAKREQVNAVRAYADIAISNPLSAHFQTGRICVSQALGAPIDERKLAARHDAEHVEPAKPDHIRVLHAPSGTALKGTVLIRREIDSLIKRGFRIQYIEVTGRPNAEVLKEIELCDFVVDELYSDDYGAVLATEAVVLGRPAIVAGYGREELDRFVPKDAVLPALYCHPNDFGALLEKMVADPAYRAEQRRKAE